MGTHAHIRAVVVVVVRQPGLCGQQGDPVSFDEGAVEDRDGSMPYLPVQKDSLLGS